MPHLFDNPSCYIVPASSWKLDEGSQIRVGSKIAGRCQQEFEKLRIRKEREFSRTRDGDQRQKLVKNQGLKGRSKVKELFFNQMSRNCIIYQPKTFHLKIKVIWQYSIHPSVWELMKWVGSKVSFSRNQDLWFPEGKGFLTMQLRLTGTHSVAKLIFSFRLIWNLASPPHSQKAPDRSKFEKELGTQRKSGE